MGCQGLVYIGDDLTFSVTTHDPDTGVLTDADSVPAYRIYEDETATAILTGSMAKLDDANTTGFYSELIACTAANGFENGKSYTIYIEATVDGDTGGITYGFVALTPIWSASSRTLTQAAASVTAAVSGSDITVHRGDTLDASLTGLGSLSGYVSIDFTVKEKKSDSDNDALIRIRLNASGSSDGLLRFNQAAASDDTQGSITIDDEADGDITIALDASLTDDLKAQSGLYYDVQLITASAVSTLTYGGLEVTADVTRTVI